MLRDELNQEMLEVLVNVLWSNHKNRKITNRANTTKESKKSYDQFKNTAIGKLHVPVNVAEHKREMFEKALGKKISVRSRIETKSLQDIVEKMSSEKNVTRVEGILATKDTESAYKRAKVQEIKGDAFDSYSPMFSLYSTYGSTVSKMEIVTYKNNLDKVAKFLEVSFVHNNEDVWTLELPFVDTDCTFTLEGNKFVFMWLPRNMEAYLKGAEDELELVHPYEEMCRRSLVWYRDNKEERDIYYEQDRLNDLIKYGKGKDLSKNISKFLMHQKENSWDESEFTPVVYLDKEKSKHAHWSYINNIAVNFTYDELVKCGIVRGIDLLSGSTSMPGVRCKIAYNYEVRKEGHKRVLRKVRDFGEYGDYMSGYKLQHIGTFKTSGKRDNTSSSKDSYALVNPQKGSKRVTIK